MNPSAGSRCLNVAEMSMRTIRTRTIACAVAMAAVLSLAPLRAQSTQAALSKEAGTLSDKFAGLARVTAGKYDWKPGEGDRKSTRLNSSHVSSSYAVFCLKKKKLRASTAAQ